MSGGLNIDLVRLVQSYDTLMPKVEVVQIFLRLTCAHQQLELHSSAYKYRNGPISPQSTVLLQCLSGRLV